MSFSIQKDNTGSIIKKTLSSGQSATITNSNSLGSSYSVFTTSVTSLSLNNQLVNSTPTDLNKTIVTPGTASAEKILVLNPDKNISGINSLSCNDIIINGTSLNSSTGGQSNLYLSNITEGTAIQSKALVLDSNKNISTINAITTNDLNINDTQLEINKPYDYNISKYSTNEILNNNNNYVSICWVDSLNLFVAISNTGTGNRVITSPDGITWTLQTTPVDNNWTSICWSSQLGLLVAISNSGTLDRVMTSTDGINWISRTTPNDNNWTSICWSPELTLFVAISNSGTDNRVMTSTNGINWISRTSSANNNWNSICWSPELTLFTAVSDQLSTGITSVMTSSNGINWTSRSASENNNWKSICWSPELTLFVAVSNSGINRIMTSNNGINWTSRYIPFLNNWKQIIWINQFNQFLIICDNYTEFPVISSNNGILWKPIQVNIKNKLNSICWSSTLKKICILSKSDDIIRYLNNWTNTNADINSGLLGNECRQVYWVNSLSLFIVIGVNKLVTSTDSLSWTSRTVPTLTWNSVIYSSDLSLLVAVGNGSATASSILTSTDAITWTTRTAPSNCNWISVCYGGPTNGKLFVAVAQNASSASVGIMTSINGTSWTNRTASSNGEWWKVIWVNELSLFICVGSSSGSRVMTSPDGITWTSRTAAAENNWKSVTWSVELNLLVAIGDTGTNQVMISFNGINWTSINCPVGLWYNVQWVSSLGLFIAVGQHTNTPYNTIIYSSNGYIWNIIQNVNNFAYRSIDWSPSLGVFVLGSISTSNNIYNIIKSSPNSSNTNIFSIISNYDSQSINISKIIKSNIVKFSTIKYSINKWYNTAAPSQITWTDICWAGFPINRFILGANSGSNKLSHLNNILTGGVLLVPTMNINALCWASEIQRMVAVGSNGSTFTNNLIYYNGSTWTYTTTPSLNNWTAVCWSSCLGMFVAVSNTGYFNRVMISYDAINWFLQKTPNNNNWTSVCWSGYLKLFVAISNSGTNNRIMTSSNGTDWISRTSPANINWSSICWANHLLLYVAVANSGTDNRIMTSTDGINWSTKTSPADNDWNYIIYINELQLLVAVASTGSKRLMYSNDSINWTLVTLPINNSWKSITWSSEYSVLVMISSDGTNQINRSHFFKLTALNTLSNNSLLSIENNKLLFGTQPLLSSTHKFEYGPTNGNNQFSLYNSTGTSRHQIQISTTGLTLNSANNMNININDHNSIDSGLSLNNILITSNANQINTIAGLSIGYAKQSKALVLDTLSNIQGINNLSCNSYTLNSSLNNITEGTALSINLLIPNNDKEILNLNILGTNNLQLKNTNLTTYAKNLTSNYLYNTVLNKSCINRNSSAMNEVCWSEDLKIFVGIGSIYSYISSDGISWASYSTGASQLTSICWSPKIKLFVAVTGSTATNLYISSNGISWSSITIPSNNWYSITWSNDLNMYAAIAQNSGSSSCIITSIDAYNWTVRTGASASWNQIIYAKDKFIGISSTLLLTSTDGINWNSSSLPVSHSWSSITYSDTLDLFVIVATSGTNRIRTSSDLSNWTIRNHLISNSFTRIIYAKEINTFMIVANSGTDNRILISNNGIDWYIRSTKNFNNSYQWITWSPLLYKFILSSGNTYVMTTNSSLLSRYADNNNFNYEMTLNNILEKNIISYSLVNNIVNNWISRSSPVSNTLTSICRSDELNLFVALSNSGTGNRIITSNYSTNWIARTNPVDNNWTSICWASELTLFVAVANTGSSDRIMTSPDGINWTSRTNPVDNNWTSVCWATELTLFVAVANSGSGNRIMTSPDGINWTSRTNPIDNNWTSVCWAPELTLFVAVANSGTNNRVMTSPDGINWTSRTNPIDNNWTSVCWANTINLFIAVANSGNKRIMYSDDGITWSNKLNFNFKNELILKDIQTANWNNIIWVSELNIAIAISSTGSKRIMISNDGITWYLENLTLVKNWIALSWSKNLGIFCCISSDTTNPIVQSIINYASENTAIIAYPGQLTINNTNKRIGLGVTSPSYQLHLSTDSAAKLSSSTWTVSSDIRLKKDIIDADLDLCYNKIKNLPLKRYTWKNDIYSDEQVNDRSKLGWIADDVELLFPSSIKKIQAFGYDDCKSLNNDQVIVTLYGAIKKLMLISETKKNIIDNLENKLNTLKNIINNLEIVEM